MGTKYSTRDNSGGGSVLEGQGATLQGMSMVHTGLSEAISRVKAFIMRIFVSLGALEDDLSRVTTVRTGMAQLWPFSSPCRQGKALKDTCSIRKRPHEIREALAEHCTTIPRRLDIESRLVCGPSLVPVG
jgi:hypothetical protein